ncbi:MAG: rhomboid family intramembrane serine protease [Spirochaetaceae bacterium]
MKPRSLVQALYERPPLVTPALLCGLLLTTIPQFFLPELYDLLTGTLFGVRLPHYLFLNVFSHSPSILLPHLLGNSVVLIFFGGISELVLGSRRMALLSLVTLTVTLATAYLRDLTSVHGISGVIWGFHVPVLFLLLARAQHRGPGSTLKSPWVLLALVLFLFDFVGIHLLEVALLGLRPFENFGQVLHLVSVVVAMPFAFAWRGDIERAARGLSAIRARGTGWKHDARSLATPSLIGLAALLLLNGAGTVDAVLATLSTPSTVSYTLQPPPGTAAEETGREIRVTFSEPMLTRDPNLRRRSISYEQPPVPEVRFRWVRSDTLIVELSRTLTKAEAILLRFDVYQTGPRGVLLPRPVELSYN